MIGSGWGKEKKVKWLKVLRFMRKERSEEIGKRNTSTLYYM